MRMMKIHTGFFSEIESYMQKTLASWQVNGAALAIIHKDEVVYSKGFGWRDANQKLPVDSGTLFAIGSASKAFTTTAMGILVDRGLLDWDTPLSTYLPDFQMYDPVASQEITPRDLVCHRSGLGGHNMPWFGADCSREELVKRVRYLEPNLDFRTGFQYQNLMFVAAGYLIERMTGLTWEEFVQAELFEPLGMSSSNFSVDVMKEAGINASLPYRLEGNQINQIPYANIDAVGPAGSINSNLKDMARWVMLQLNDGSYDGNCIITEPGLRDLHAPHMLIQGGMFPVLDQYPGMRMDQYGLGWFIQDYCGSKVIHHGGHIDGFAALISFSPDLETGVVFLSNDNRTLFGLPPTFYVYDRLKGLQPQPWNERLLSFLTVNEQTQNIGEEKDENQALETSPSCGARAYAGEYRHPGYGSLRVLTYDEKLQIEFNGQQILLTHYHYDTFKCVYEEEGNKYKVLVRFEINKAGKVNQIEIPFEPSVKDIIFKKIN